MIQARLDALQVSRFRQENEEAIGAHCYSQLRMSAHKWVSTRRYPSGEKPGTKRNAGERRRGIVATVFQAMAIRLTAFVCSVGLWVQAGAVAL